MVDNTIQLVTRAIAKQLHWDEIAKLVKKIIFEDCGKTYAVIESFKLDTNHIILELK